MVPTEPAAVGTCAHEQVRKIAGRFVCASCGADISTGGTGVSTAAIGSLPAWLRGWHLTNTGAQRLGGGAVLAALLAWIGGFAWWMVMTLTTLVHECGHAAMAWCVARPALPKFDLQYGGGITNWGERMSLLLILWGVVWVWMARLTWRSQLRWLVLCAAIFQAFLICSECDRTAISYAGHGMELVIAAVFLVRAATGIAVAHAAEGWLYAILGWSLWGISFGFARRVIADVATRDQYLAGKGGVLDNDFVVLADQTGWSLNALLYLHQVLAIIAVVIAVGVSGWLVARRQARSFHQR